MIRRDKKNNNLMSKRKQKRKNIIRKYRADVFSNLNILNNENKRETLPIFKGIEITNQSKAKFRYSLNSLKSTSQRLVKKVEMN